MGTTSLWGMVLAMGVYQGLNPTMGWLHGVARGLERRSGAAVLGATFAVAAGHYLAMAAVLLPAALALALSGLPPMAAEPWLGGALLGFGLFKLCRRAHPRALARIRPGHTLRWSFLMALAHCGSPLMMLSPLASLLVLLQLQGRGGPDALARAAWFAAAALALPAAMIAALLLTASLAALLVHRSLGLAALTRFWIDLDLGWALAFLAMGGMALAMGAAGGAMPGLPAWAMVLARSLCRTG